MPDHIQDEYSGSIDERLFPYYKNLESAAELFVDSSESCKYLYEGKIRDALTALTAAKTVIKKPGNKKG